MGQNSFYKIIFKNTGLFGISQAIKILARIVTNKVAAIFIGPAGIGIIGILENIIGLIQGFTNFGIAQSSVREVALVSEGENVNKTKESWLLKIIYQWALATGVLGALVALIFSKYINLELFSESNFNIWILILGLYFVFSSISSIRLAVLQAKKKVEVIVKFHIVSAIFISILSTSFYYIWGVNGIIPVFLCTSFIQFLYSLYLTKDIKTSSEKVSLKQAFNEGLPMAKIGLLLSVSVVFGQICFYIIRWFLKEYYSFDTLGIYQVSNTFLVGYLGLVFAAMSNDFYPRLCNYENDKVNFNTLINDQTELALFIVLPAIMGLYSIAPFLIKTLYTEDFLDVLLILKIGLVAVVLKAIVWPIGYISLIKGNKSLYLKQNLLGDGINVIASLLFFYYLGYIGLGLAMLTMFIVSGCYNYYVAVKLYDFKFRKNTLKIIGVSILISIIAVTLIFYTGFVKFNYPFIFLTLITTIYSFKHIKKKVFK